MRAAEILYKGEAAGRLQQFDDGSFEFRYHDAWYNATDKPPISLNFPKKQQAYKSESLFPFFYHMLPEGSNKATACFQLRIDPTDHFGLLLHTAQFDTIGAITIKRLAE